MEIVTCDEVLATSADVLGVLCRFVATTGKKQVRPDRLNVKNDLLHKSGILWHWETQHKK